MKTYDSLQDEVQKTNSVYAAVLRLITAAPNMERDIHTGLYLHYKLWKDIELDEEGLHSLKCSFYERFTHPDFVSTMKGWDARLREALFGPLRIKSLVAHIVPKEAKSVPDPSRFVERLGREARPDGQHSKSPVHKAIGCFLTSKKPTIQSRSRKRVGFELLFGMLNQHNLSSDDGMINAIAKALELLEKQNVDPLLAEGAVSLILSEILVDKEFYNAEDKNKFVSDKFRREGRHRANSIRKKNREITGIEDDVAGAAISRSEITKGYSLQRDWAAEHAAQCVLEQASNKDSATEPICRERPRTTEIDLNMISESILISTVKKLLPTLDDKKKEILVGIAIDQLNAPENAQKLFLIFDKAIASVDSISRLSRKLEDEIKEIAAELAIAGL